MVCIANSEAFTFLSNNGRNFMIMNVTNTRKKVVLDLIYKMKKKKFSYTSDDDEN